MSEITYQVVNMPMLLSEDPRLMMRILRKASDADISILEIESVKLIVNFKWRTYAKSFYMQRLMF